MSGREEEHPKELQHREGNARSKRTAQRSVTGGNSTKCCVQEGASVEMHSLQVDARK